MMLIGGLSAFLLGMKHLSEGLQAVGGAGLRKFMGLATTHRIAGIGTGIVSTLIVQSSAIITAMLVGFVSSGMMTLRQAINVIFGANIGTTITAWLAAIGGTSDARRAALAQPLSNVIGSRILIPLAIPVLVPLGKALFPRWDVVTETAKGPMLLGIMAPIAVTDTIFSVLRGILTFPFVAPFARLVIWMIPSKEREIPHLSVPNIKLIRTPVLAVEQVEHQIIFMAESDLELLGSFRDLLSTGEDHGKEEHILHRENILDVVQREITNYLGQLMAIRLPQDVADQARMLLRAADEYESVSDEVASLLKMLRRMWKNDLPLSDQGREELLTVHDAVTRFGHYVTDAQRADLMSRPDLLTHMKVDAANISTLIKSIRATHISRLESNAADPLKIVVCMDILTAYNRIKEDYVNIAETMVGGKGQ
ncbi:MAG: Na/Pi cotransporter family protein [Kiritimatiellae bacterium]|nr:Na/Pi cotransporter family protein [Kiritimatiellia bacterium]